MFLYGQALTQEVRELLKGDNPKMMVAFLGANLIANLFENAEIPKNLQIICDIEMGSTNPKALKELGAPDNESLKHLPKKQMHAKIYISNEGAIVSSLNASATSLNNDNRIEAGVKLSPGTDEYKDVLACFKKHWKEAEKIDANALALASARFASPPIVNNSDQDNARYNLLDLLRHNPKALGSVGIVFTKIENDPNILDVSLEHSQNELEKISLTDEKKMLRYDSWKIEDINNWPLQFIEIFFDPEEDDVQICKGLRSYYDEENDVLYARKVDWRTSGNNFGGCVRLTTLETNKDYISRNRDLLTNLPEKLTAHGICVMNGLG